MVIKGSGSAGSFGVPWAPDDPGTTSQSRTTGSGPAPGRAGHAARRPATSPTERLAEYRPDERALPAFHMWTLGCQMNRSDSEEMAGRLLAAGCAEAPSMEAADLIVINTCAIREGAEQKVIGRQGHLARLKEANPGLRVVLTGCSVREPHRDGLHRRYPAVDLFLRPGRGARARGPAGTGVRAGTDRRGRRDHGRGTDGGGRRRPPGGHPGTSRRRGRGRARLGDQRLAADHLRLRQDVHLLHRSVQPRSGAQPAVRRDRRRGARAGRGRLPGGHAPRSERQQLRPRPARPSRASPTSTPSAGPVASSTSTGGPTSPS